MAYVSQEMKSKLAPAIKAVLKKYNVKATIAVRTHSTLVVNIKEGALDIIGDYLKAGKLTDYQAEYVRKHKSVDVNTYWIQDHYTGKSKKFLMELKDAMEGPEFFNEDDAQTDYFCRSHYIDINVGKWNKPYIVA